MKIRYLRRALRDLDALQDYIAGDNPSAAEKTVLTIRRHIGRLAEQPRLGRPGRTAGTRELAVPGTAYVVAYRVTDETVDVLAVVHGARIWPHSF
jgi:toxin ParE1/3/4